MALLVVAVVCGGILIHSNGVAYADPGSQPGIGNYAVIDNGLSR
jgi:hypothetical protein